MMNPGMMQDMRSIHGLLINHDQIERKVEDIPNGVRTTTTSENPQVAQLIREHVRQMKARYARGQPIRMMDAIFREVLRNREKVPSITTRYLMVCVPHARPKIRRWCF